MLIMNIILLSLLALALANGIKIAVHTLLNK